MSEHDVCANCGKYYMEHERGTTVCIGSGTESKWFPKALADAITASRVTPPKPIDTAEDEVEAPQEATKKVQVAPRLYGNPDYLRGLWWRVQRAIPPEGIKSLSELFEAEIEEMEKREPKPESPQAEGAKSEFDRGYEGGKEAAIEYVENGGQYDLAQLMKKHLLSRYQPSSLAGSGKVFDELWKDFIQDAEVEPSPEEEGFARWGWNMASGDYANGYIDGREAGYHSCGSCSHTWEAHDGECGAYMPDGSICGCSWIKRQQSRPVIEPQLMNAINWLMGCGDSDFIKPEGAPTYWWRSEFAKRAGLEYDGKQFRKAQGEFGK